MAKPVPQAVFRPAEDHPRQSCAGPSLLDLMWASLVEEMASIMPGGEYHEDEAPQGDDVQRPSERLDEIETWYAERHRIQGACQGIAACIALVLNPYYPDVDAVKQEAVTRWTAQEAAAGAGTEDD